MNRPSRQQIFHVRACDALIMPGSHGMLYPGPYASSGQIYAGTQHRAIQGILPGEAVSQGLLFGCVDVLG